MEMRAGTTDAEQHRAPEMLPVASLLLRGFEAVAVTAAGIITLILLADSLRLEPTEQYFRVALLASVVYALVAELSGCYEVQILFSARSSWTRVLAGWSATATVMLVLAFFLKTSEEFSRSWTIVWFVTAAVTLCLVRTVGTTWLRRMRARGVLNQRVVIFGSGSPGERLASYIRNNSNLMIDLLGFCDDRRTARDGQPIPGLAYLGSLESLIESIKLGEVDQVIIALPAVSESRLREVVGRLAMLPVLTRLAPYAPEMAFTAHSFVFLGELPLVTLFERPISGLDQVIKRVEDLVLASLLLMVLAPLFIIIAIAIKLDSPGSIFFRQPREGFNHNVFRIWKFRTMRAAALEYDDIRQATQNDTRVTRVGRLLRMTSLDEVPQLINVLSGEMSLVGPRPHASSTRIGDVRFAEVAQNYAARHRVKPGMTGWAQVNGWRGETDTEEKLLKRIEYDLFYIENWSIGFDLYIMIRTFVAVVSARAAY
jgi:Undecaprenyl-phosphate glucose phosphotransferase